MGSALHSLFATRYSPASSRGANNAAVGGFQDHRDLFAVRKLFLEMNGRAPPLPHGTKRADDIGFRHGAAAIFAAPDRRDVLAVKTHQHHARSALAGADVDRGLSVPRNQADLGS